MSFLVDLLKLMFWSESYSFPPLSCKASRAHVSSRLLFNKWQSWPPVTWDRCAPLILAVMKTSILFC